MVKRAKTIMIQGTASNAGKSLLCGGLCRVFAQAGYKVAPFKSQNMALNSFVTRDGLEMGRAQVMQAQCAGVEPDVRMNPILLKPTSDSGSQVILHGEVVGNMQAKDYYARKGDLAGPVMEAFDSLAADYDIIVLEGAGSPAEINLKDRDIVNMGMARMAHSPVLLAGDIDRGGVFAALAGTHLLFEQWERELLKGVIINKFRGDVGLLRPGLRMLEDLIGTPVLGVVPYLNIDVDDEDSLSSRLDVRRPDALIDIAVVHLPHISNFTDFSALSATPGVGVRYVRTPDQLGAPDLLILPGSKSTMSDLHWLRRVGLESPITAYTRAGGPLLGICGGYQMLGQTLRDPDRVESGGEMAGLGLLPMDTVFLPAKTRRQVTGTFLQATGLLSCLSGMAVSGYEIHMGSAVQRSPETRPLARLSDESGVREEGAVLGNVCGSYVHGLFDGAGIAGAVAQALAARKGISLPQGEEDYGAYRERQYNLLADGLRSSLNMEEIYRILEEGVS